MKLHDFAASTLVPMFLLSFCLIMFEANAKEAEVSFELDDYKNSTHREESKEQLEVQDQNLILEMFKSKGLIEEDLTENRVSVVI